MFSAHLMLQRQRHPARSELGTLRLGQMAADEGAAHHDQVGLSVGGIVLATAASILGACFGALPIRFDFSGLPTAGCWTIAAIYLLMAAHWMRIMLHDGSDTTAKRS